MTLAAAGAANQRADRVAHPGAIIQPVLELPQTPWLQSSRRLAGEVLAGLLQE
jgi:hypothetical protein